MSRSVRDLRDLICVSRLSWQNNENEDNDTGEEDLDVELEYNDIELFDRFSSLQSNVMNSVHALAAANASNCNVNAAASSPAEVSTAIAAAARSTASVKVAETIDSDQPSTNSQPTSKSGSSGASGCSSSVFNSATKPISASSSQDKLVAKIAVAKNFQSNYSCRPKLNKMERTEMKSKGHFDDLLNYIDCTLVSDWLSIAHATLQDITDWCSSDDNFVSFANFWLSDFSDRDRMSLLTLEHQVLRDEMRFIFEAGLDSDSIHLSDISSFLSSVFHEYPSALLGPAAAHTFLDYLDILTLRDGSTVASKREQNLDCSTEVSDSNLNLNHSCSVEIDSDLGERRKNKGSGNDSSDQCRQNLINSDSVEHNGGLFKCTQIRHNDIDSEHINSLEECRQNLNDGSRVNNTKDRCASRKNMNDGNSDIDDKCKSRQDGYDNNSVSNFDSLCKCRKSIDDDETNSDNGNNSTGNNHISVPCNRYNSPLKKEDRNNSKHKEKERGSRSADSFHTLLSDVRCSTDVREHAQSALAARAYSVISMWGAVVGFYRRLRGDGVVDSRTPRGGQRGSARSEGYQRVLEAGKGEAGVQERRMCCAIRGDYVGVVHYLLRTGKVANSYHDHLHRSLLFLAVLDNRPRVVNYLISRCNGLDVNSQAASGNTALHAAVGNGNTEMVGLLLGVKDIDVNSTNRLCDNMTPLHTAVIHDHIAIVRLLLKAGANPNSMLVSGQSVFELAKDLEHYDIALLIRDVIDPDSS